MFFASLVYVLSHLSSFLCPLCNIHLELIRYFSWLNYSFLSLALCWGAVLICNIFLVAHFICAVIYNDPIHFFHMSGLELIQDDRLNNDTFRFCAFPDFY